MKWTQDNKAPSVLEFCPVGRQTVQMTEEAGPRVLGQKGWRAGADKGWGKAERKEGLYQTACPAACQAGLSRGLGQRRRRIAN